MNNIASNRIVLFIDMNGFVDETTQQPELYRRYIKNLSKLLNRHLFLDVVLAIRNQQLPEVNKLMECFDENSSCRVTSRIIEADGNTSSIGVISGWFKQMTQSYKDWLVIAHENTGSIPGKTILKMSTENGFSDEDYFALIKKFIILRLR